MKVLFVGAERTPFSGGDHIQSRNLSILSNYYGADNITQVNFPAGMKQIPLNMLAIQSILKKGSFDLIYFDNSRVCFCPQRLSKRYYIFTFYHNVEQDYFSDMYNNSKLSKFKIKRHIYNWIERTLCKRAFRNITLNERDSARLLELYGRGADSIWPTSFADRFNPQYTAPFEGTGKGYLLFVGFDFFGNTDGLFWFIRECMPHIDVPLKIVGTGMEKYRYMNTDNVEFIGWVEDLDAYYLNSMAVVLPIISGSGMKTKTCEAMMLGKDVIGTDEAFEGYGDVESLGYIRCNTSDEFIDSINSYVQSNRPTFNEKAREYYVHNFSDESVKEKAFQFLSETFK